MAFDHLDEFFIGVAFEGLWKRLRLLFGEDLVEQTVLPISLTCLLLLFLLLVLLL